MKVTFITTGGTIDKDYAPGAGAYDFEIGEPAIGRILEAINPGLEFEIIPLFRKDSLDISEQDRQLIFDVCNDVENDSVIISHGTDTINKTAEKLSAIKAKTVVIFGSSRPERFKDSDAAFNLGVALGAINCLDAGIYIAMNGRVHNWDKCKKEAKTGRFVGV